MSIPGSASPLFLTSAAAAEPAAFQIDRSLRFNSADSASLTQTFSSNGDRQKWTFSFWIKRSKLGTKQQIFGVQGTSDGDYSEMYFDTDDKLFIRFGYLSVVDAKPAAVFRDVSAWYHIVIALDTQNSTANNRLRVYVNGTELDDYSDDSRSSFTGTYGIGRAGAHKISGEPNGSGSEIDGYLAEVHYVNGSQLAASDFGEYDDNNNWNPKAYSGTYGTNGFHLDFSDNTSTTTIAEDSSGNNNDWTANNISVTSGAGNDSMIDTPTNYDDGTNVGGNYATLNAVSVVGNDPALRNGNLSFSGSSSGQTSYISTIASDKFYYEAVFDVASGNGALIGVLGTTQQQGSRPGQVDDGYTWRATAGSFFIDGVNQGSYGSYNANGNNIIGVAVDSTAGTLEYFVNGTSQGTATSSLPAGKYFAIVADGGSTSAITDCTVNFGQRPFEYTPPSGFKSLCSTNLPDPTIADGSTAMDAVTYTGNGTTQGISGLNFSPDFAWIKRRSSTFSSLLYDTVRGSGPNKGLISDSTTAEGGASDNSTYGYLSSFDFDGFSLVAGSLSGYVNTSGQTYVGWAWDGGTTTVNNNTDGSITPTGVRANQTAGFSIVTYTGSANGTVGHGLNAAPEFIIAKSRTVVKSWVCYHKALGKDKYLLLNSTNAAQTSSGVWGSAEPTSSVFGLENSSTGGNTDGNLVAYCFAPVEGYSAFGSYEGNGSTDGTFVYTGFRPKFLLVKGDANIDWIIEDSSRDTFNQMNKRLYPNDSVAESTSSNGNLDFLSNGFKPRTTHLSLNSSGTTYYWAAFAEHPFRTARAR